MANDTILNTFKGNDVASRRALYNAINNAKSLNANDVWPIEVCNIVIVAGTRAVSGEDCENVYLICENGDAYFSQSNGIAKSAKQLAELFDFGDGTSIPVEVSVQQNSRSGNTIKSLRIAD